MTKRILFIIFFAVFVLNAVAFSIPDTKAALPNIQVQFQTNPLFNQANFAPGSTVTGWMKVTNNYNSPRLVAIEAINVVDTGGLASQINFVIKTGATVIYSGTLQNIIDSGELPLTTLAGSATIQYDFSATFSSSAGNQYQGKKVGFDLLAGFEATGNITIIKKTVGGDDTFGFTGNLGQFNIQTVSGGGTKNFNSLTPGTYTVTEPSDVKGWTLTSVVCVDPGGGSKGNNRNAVIKLTPGTTVTCTFTNTKTQVKGK
jgi:hypothetical protein